MADVIVRSLDGLAQEVIAGAGGKHRLTADEPVDAGGADSGPGPYDLLLASLGACTAMTVRLYADRKQWPLEGVEVHLSHDRIYARDCADCEADGTEGSRIEQITKRLVLRGALSEEQRGRLNEIAERCPVRRTLASAVHFVQELAPPVVIYGA